MGEPGPAGAEEHGTGSSTTDRLAEKAHHTIDSAARSAGEYERRARESATEARERARSAEQRAEAQIEESIDRVRNYVERNPMASAGIAFVAGMLLSGLLRR